MINESGICKAVIQFFELVIEKYIKDYANPLREWHYFKTLLSQNVDLNRIESYLKVLKSNQDSIHSTPEITPLKPDLPMFKMTTPLSEHNVQFTPLAVTQLRFQEIDSKMNTQEKMITQEKMKVNPSTELRLSKQISCPNMTIAGRQLSVNFRGITQRIVNQMNGNNISFILLNTLY